MYTKSMFNYQLPYKICDPIHGFIRFDEIERKVIDTGFFQRLRYIRQMGVSYLVYPGANHTRFEHSLGVMDLATRIYETIMAKHNLVFSQMVPIHLEEKAYWCRILRLAALCHDMGHLPFSHTAEPDLFPTGGHERMTFKIIQSEALRTIWRMIPSQGRSVEEDILKLCVSEKELKEFDPKIVLGSWESVLSQVITEDNFGADRMDYLIRDAQNTGVGYGHFDYHQLIDTLRILPSLKETHLLTIGVAEGGVQSIESLWIARYLMSARVYQHPKARIFNYHMCRFMTHHYSKKGFPTALAGYVRETDATILAALYQAADEGDYDALTLLKEEKGFQEILVDSHTEAKVIENLEELKKYKEILFVDYDPDAKEVEHLRQFPVLSESGPVMLSSQVSPFLRDIPIGSKKLRLFAHPDKVEEIKAILSHHHIVIQMIHYPDRENDNDDNDGNGRSKNN